MLVSGALGRGRGGKSQQNAPYARGLRGDEPPGPGAGGEGGRDPAGSGRPRTNRRSNVRACTQESAR